MNWRYLRGCLVISCFESMKRYKQIEFSGNSLSIVTRGSSVGIATRYGMDDRRVGVRTPVRSRIFTYSWSPDQLWGATKLLSNGYRGGIFLGDRAERT
jgi:hypothetical protein